MEQYIKLFTNHTAYEAAKNNIDKPNVTMCQQENEVHFNPIVIAQPLIATYNVEDASNPTPLFVGAESMSFPASAIYDKIEIDNVEIDMSDLSSSEQGGMTIYGYTFESTGQHTVKYTLKDPTMIGVKFDEETDMPSKLGATFINCPITSVEIPNSVTTIDDYAFNGCFYLTSVTIPNNVISIGNGAFTHCENLASVTIPNSVTTIDSYAFSSCFRLPSVTIPDSVTSIGDYAFDALQLVIIYATTPPSENIFFSPVYDGNDIMTVIQVPLEAVNTYKTTWSDYAEIIEAIPTASVITFTIDNVQKQTDLQAQWWNQWVNMDNRFIVDLLNGRSCIKDIQTGYWVSTTSYSSGVISAYDRIVSNGQYYTIEVSIK